MNKTTKGGLAAGAAAVLLLGGAGTLAFWTDDATLDGGTATSGFLSIDEGECGDFSYAGSTIGSGAVENFVPGDVITMDCTFLIGAEGDNLAATPTVDEDVVITAEPQTAGGPAATTFTADVDATYALGNRATFAASPTITEDDNGDTLTASITVTFPYGDATTINANDTQNILATLEDLTVSLEQNNPNP